MYIKNHFFAPMALTTNISLGSTDYMEQSNSLKWTEVQEQDEEVQGLEEFMYYAAYCSSDDDDDYDQAQAQVNAAAIEQAISNVRARAFSWDVKLDDSNTGITINPFNNNDMINRPYDHDRTSYDVNIDSGLTNNDDQNRRDSNDNSEDDLSLPPPSPEEQISANGIERIIPPAPIAAIKAVGNLQQNTDTSSSNSNRSGSRPPRAAAARAASRVTASARQRKANQKLNNSNGHGAHTPSTKSGRNKSKNNGNSSSKNGNNSNNGSDTPITPPTSSSSSTTISPPSLYAAVLGYNRDSSITYSKDVIDSFRGVVIDGKVGVYTLKERAAIIDKFRTKKRNRIWKKTIKYDCRKRLAEIRPRVKGRFVSRKESAEMKDANGNATGSSASISNNKGASTILPSFSDHMKADIDDIDDINDDSLSMSNIDDNIDDIDHLDGGIMGGIHGDDHLSNMPTMPGINNMDDNINNMMNLTGNGSLHL